MADTQERKKFLIPREIMLVWSAVFFWHCWALTQTLLVPSAEIVRCLVGLPKATELFSGKALKPLGPGLLVPWVEGTETQNFTVATTTARQVCLPERAGLGFPGASLFYCCRWTKRPVSQDYRMEGGALCNVSVGLPSSPSFRLRE